MIPHSKSFVDDEDCKAVNKQTKSGLHSYGNQTSLFEKKLSELIEKDFGKATTSGTTALHIALATQNLTEKDEIIITSFSCQSLLNAINYTKAKPVLVDIQDDYLVNGYNISIDTITPSVTKNTKVIIVPHMFGVPADIEPIMVFAEKNNIIVIEDCAQSMGATYQEKSVGHYGHISVFSFYATKVISTGQGGMVLTSKPELKEKIIDLTTYDSREIYRPAFNYTLSDIQSALGLTQLKKLPYFIKRRQEISKKYNKSFNGKFLIANYENGFPFRYLIHCADKSQREILKNKLKEKGIISSLPFIKPLHHYFNLPKNKFINSDKAFETILSLPIYPALTDAEVDYIIESVKEISKNF